MLLTFKRFNIYSLCSFFALICDCVIYYSLLIAGLFNIPVAASLGYLGGLLIAYMLLIRYVFFDKRSRDRSLELALFILSGFLGVFLTFISVKVYVSIFEENIFRAKFFAVSISFITIYLFRRLVVFRS